MGHGPRRSNRRLVLGGLAAIALAVGTVVPAVAAFAVDDYPLPPPPVVGPTDVSRPSTGPVPTEVEGTTVTKTKTGNNGVEVLGAQVTRGSIPFTGGDVAGLVAIGAGAVAVGAVMVRRTRRTRAKA